MKKSVWLAVVVVLVILATLACQSSTTGGGDTKVLFKDDFSGKSGGWTTEEDSDVLKEYANGGFRIYAKSTQMYFWTRPDVNYSDVVIEVDATRVAGPELSDVGLICRYNRPSEDAPANFYIFTISGTGYYGISKLKDGNEEWVGMSEAGYSDKISSSGLNHLRIECNGSTLSLTVNGTLLVSVQDTDFTSGDVGMITGTYDEAGVDVLFDNFVVSKP